MKELSVLLSVSPIIAKSESMEIEAASTCFPIVEELLTDNSRGR